MSALLLYACESGGRGAGSIHIVINTSPWGFLENKWDNLGEPNYHYYDYLLLKAMQ